MKKLEGIANRDYLPKREKADINKACIIAKIVMAFNDSAWSYKLANSDHKTKINLKSFKIRINSMPSMVWYCGYFLKAFPDCQVIVNSSISLEEHPMKVLTDILDYLYTIGYEEVYIEPKLNRNDPD